MSSRPTPSSAPQRRRSIGLARTSRAAVWTLALGAAGCGSDAAPHVISLGDASTMVGEPGSLAGVTDLHNQARAMVRPRADPALPAMSWSPTLAADAATHAATCTFEHSGNGHGENIYAAAGFVPDAEDVVGSWVSEYADYHYASNTCDDVCGHYTQVVWRESTSLGCALRTCNTGSPFSSPTWTFVVCNYDPPGNVNGRRPY